MYLPCALVCARAVVGDSDILDGCARDLPLPSDSAHSFRRHLKLIFSKQLSTPPSGKLQRRRFNRLM